MMENIGKLIKTISEKYIRERLEDVEGIFILGFSRISAPQLSMFRSMLNAHKARFMVIKNSIARRVFKSKGFEGLISVLEGPCGIVYVNGDSVAVAKIIFNFAKENEGLKIRGGVLKDTIIFSQEISQLATLPSREILYAQVVQVLRSPFNLLVMTLKEIPRRLVSVLNSIKDKK
ncbi:MAG: 50S ribosomal protein L10 [Candidatus Omnitrophica bacterium]|nr:50S ribosomal protein L10 [Candidatus Omnitrophota bacterium]